MSCPDANLIGIENRCNIMGVYPVNSKDYNAMMSFRIFGTYDVHMRNLFHSLHEISTKLRLSFLNKGKSDFVQIRNCRCKTNCTAYIYRTCLKLMRKLCPGSTFLGHILYHFSAEKEGGHFFQKLLLSIYGSDSHRGIELMSGKCQKVHIQILHIHLGMGNGLGSVTNKYSSNFMSKLCKKLNVLNISKNIGNLSHCHQLYLGI